MSDVLRLREEALEWRILDDELVALDEPSSTFFTVNRTGRTLWPALARGATREELITLLVTQFGVDQETAGRDLDRFLVALAERGLLAADT
ncbi:MAG: PqqD family protein [Gaiellaceae bacterium]